MREKNYLNKIDEMEKDELLEMDIHKMKEIENIVIILKKIILKKLNINFVFKM
jgi:hypothetical protein